MFWKNLWMSRFSFLRQCCKQCWIIKWIIMKRIWNTCRGLSNSLRHRCKSPRNYQNCHSPTTLSRKRKVSYWRACKPSSYTTSPIKDTYTLTSPTTLDSSACMFSTKEWWMMWIATSVRFLKKKLLRMICFRVSTQYRRWKQRLIRWSWDWIRGGKRAIL